MSLRELNEKSRAGQILNRHSKFKKNYGGKLKLFELTVEIFYRPTVVKNKIKIRRRSRRGMECLMVFDERDKCNREQHLRNGMRSNFMSISIKILDQAIVRPLMRYKKCRSNFASIWICTRRIKEHFENFIVHIIHRVFEGDEN